MFDLKERWQAFWGAQGVSPAVSLVAYAHLAQAYGALHRLYHNLGHIRHCLEVFDSVHYLANYPVEVEAAIWYHDVVYNTTASDNEERSVEYAWKDLKKFGVPQKLAGRIAVLIMATKLHQGEQTQPDAQLMADIDLSSLGVEWDMFWLYTKDIRNEYRHVDGRAFAHGRAKILRRFLARDPLYYTQEMRDRYEAQARANLAKSVMLLEEQAAA